MKQVSRMFTLLALLLTFSSVGFAQKPRATALSRLLMKHTYNGEYDLPERRVESPDPQSRVKSASGSPFIFTDHVWFPGEWEEVKAVLVSPRYEYRPADYYDDKRYSAKQIVPGWGYIYFKKDPNDQYEQAKYVSSGYCVPKVDVETEDGELYLYIMDAIQKAGAKAWVRIQNEEDDDMIINAMKELHLSTDSILFFLAPGNSIWFRDCGPICFYYGNEDNIAMLDFFYGGDRALDDLLPSYLHRKFGIPNYITDVRWEGGNCLVDGLGGLVTSTSSYEEPTDTLGRLWWDGTDPQTITWAPRQPLINAEVREALGSMLGQRQTLIVPKLNYDGRTGHVDLYLDATDENSFYITQMPEEYDTWTDYDIVFGNTNILLNKNNFFNRKYYNKGAIPFPSYNGKKWRDEEQYGGVARTYANHLICNNYIIQPCFSFVDPVTHMPTDPIELANIQKLRDIYKGYTFYCIDMRAFDGSGGSIHCITKQIPADDPVRIIHKDIHDNVNPESLGYIPFSSVITNKNGIKEAKLIYRVNEGDWAEYDLTANGNCWSAEVNLDYFLGTGQPVTAEGTKVEYYIQATTYKDKTITKPFTASNGGYYEFVITNSVAYDASMFDFYTAPMPMENITFELSTAWLYEDTSTDDEESTGVVELQEHKSTVNPDAWYSIDGKRFDSRPSVKGFVINNGKIYMNK